MEEERRSGFNPANSMQIDPNETLRIPSEFQQHQHHPKQNGHLHRSRENVQYSPFINCPNPTIGFTNSSLIPPDSPLIHVNGRLSLKSPSINSKNYNTTILNSPYPNRSSNKVPRPVYRRQS